MTVLRGGQRLLLTQAAAAARDWQAELDLHAPDVRVSQWPLVRIDPVEASVARPILARLGEFDWIFLPSPSVVAGLASLLSATGCIWPDTARAALPGPGTVAAFRRYFGPDLAVDAPPAPPHDADHLVSILTPPTGRIGRALLLRRADGRTDWVGALEARGIRLESAALFRAQGLDPPSGAAEAVRAWREAGERLHVVAGARSALDRLGAWLGGIAPEDRDWFLASELHVPHDGIAAWARKLGHVKLCIYPMRRSVLSTLQSGAPRVDEARADRSEI